MENFPNINKVDGKASSLEVEKQLVKISRSAQEEFGASELEPTEEEEKIIESVSFGLRIMLENVYKIPFKQILREKIHIVRGGKLSNEYGRGIYQSPTGEIYIEELQSIKSRIVFAKVLAHELIHYLSFVSVKATETDKCLSVRPHIDGLGILRFEDEGVREYFGVLDEAATSYISNKFLNLELDRVRNNPEEKSVFLDEVSAVDLIREWLHDLPDSFGLDKSEWNKYYVVSIPFAEEIAKVIKSDATTEEKVRFYRSKTDGFSKGGKLDFYLERAWEIEQVYKEISEMFVLENPDPIFVREKTMELVNRLVLLKLTGQGFLEIVRFVEKRLGRGSFKRLAEKFSNFKSKL